MERGAGPAADRERDQLFVRRRDPQSSAGAGRAGHHRSDHIRTGSGGDLSALLSGSGGRQRNERR